MLYVIPDTLLKLNAILYVIPDTLFVSLNTNKIGHHVLRYTWHIVESVTNKTGHHVLRYTWHIF